MANSHERGMANELQCRLCTGFEAQGIIKPTLNIKEIQLASQKTAFFIVTAAKTSNLTLKHLFPKYRCPMLHRTLAVREPNSLVKD
jgi:hypothetical protein